MEQEAADTQRTGCTSVIVQDNGPMHRCKEVQKLWSKWESMDLYIFVFAQILFRNEFH
jgi:putative transposase